MGGTRLLGWFVAGEIEAVDWDAVYAEELPRVYNYFRYRGVLNRATAEDLTSLTFERAWAARGRYRKDRASVATWLLAIARNLAIDHFRRRHPEVVLDDTHASGAATPEETVLRDGELQRLGVLLRALPAREREILALKYGADVTNRAIAKLLGLSESNVGTILHRTLSGLRAAWDEGGGS